MAVITVMQCSFTATTEDVHASAPCARIYLNYYNYHYYINDLGIGINTHTRTAACTDAEQTVRAQQIYITHPHTTRCPTLHDVPY